MFRTALHICEGNTTGESAAVERIESDGGGAQALRDEEEGPPSG